MDIQQLLSMLEGVRPSGPGKWMARCRGHNDKTASMGIKLTDDGKILLHCFAGCDVSSIVGAMGLTLADLMPENPEYRKSGKTPRFNKYELFDVLVSESAILMLAVRHLLKGESLNDVDLGRVRRAERSIWDIVREVRR